MEKSTLKKFLTGSADGVRYSIWFDGNIYRINSDGKTIAEIRKSSPGILFYLENAIPAEDVEKVKIALIQKFPTARRIHYTETAQSGGEVFGIGRKKHSAELFVALGLKDNIHKISGKLSGMIEYEPAA